MKTKTGVALGPEWTCAVPDVALRGRQEPLTQAHRAQGKGAMQPNLGIILSLMTHQNDTSRSTGLYVSTFRKRCIQPRRRNIETFFSPTSFVALHHAHAA